MSKRRFVLVILALSALAILATGCDSSKLSNVEYNNEIVDALNNTSASIEASTIVYDEDIPNIVTESSEIDTANLESALIDAQEELENAKTVLDLKSSDEEQQAAIEVEFQNYLNLGTAYLETYQEMVDYYATGAYSEDLNGVGEYDTLLHEEYNLFIEANNTLVEILNENVN